MRRAGLRVSLDAPVVRTVGKKAVGRLLGRPTPRGISRRYGMITLAPVGTQTCSICSNDIVYCIVVS